MPEPDALDAVADELYDADPAGFVARRDAFAKQARARKERALADAIKALRRPTIGAWYVNLASRSRLTSLVELLRLGRELRDAQAALDFKRVVALGPRRAELERRVLADLTAHLATLGVSATASGLEEVRSTLRAALTDPDAAAAVESGRLDKPLAYGGFDGFGAALPGADGEDDRGPDAPAPSSGAARPAEDGPPPPPPAEEAAGIDELERLAAQRGLAQAHERAALTGRVLADARAARDEAAARLAEADAALARAEADDSAARADLESWRARAGSDAS